jgi:hypothetical protein
MRPTYAGNPTAHEQFDSEGISEEGSTTIDD